jgi:hypothetical protein
LFYGVLPKDTQLFPKEQFTARYARENPRNRANLMEVPETDTAIIIPKIVSD